MQPETVSTPPSEKDPGDSSRLYAIITLLIQGVIAVELVLFIVQQDWENVLLTAIVIGLTLAPAFLSRRYHVYIPPEFQLITAAFIFLSLYLGSARDFYYHYWWWDVVLHACSGFLLGIIGFLTLFLLNKTDRLPPGVRPAFLCFFGVTFAVFLGVLWEIFEFTVDSLFPWINMQSRETGVIDTMLDLIVDLLGAIVVGLMGWAYTRSGRYSFVADGVRKFVRANPRLFRALPHKRE